MSPEHLSFLSMWKERDHSIASPAIHAIKGMLTFVVGALGDHGFAAFYSVAYLNDDVIIDRKS